MASSTPPHLRKGARVNARSHPQPDPLLARVNGLEAQRGEVVGLLGANGSGKSTLLRCLAGLLPVPRATVSLAGRDIRAMRRRQVATTVSYLPQAQETLNHLTVGELVARGRHPHTAGGWRLTNHDRAAVSSALAYMQLEDLADRPVNQVSGGERQRAWIAMVLAHDTPLMLFDEPVTFLDIKHQWSLLELLTDLAHNRAKTLVVVFHDINHAMAACHRVYLLRNGRVAAQGEPEDVITPHSLQHVYGVDAHVCHIRQACRSVVVPNCPRLRPDFGTKPTVSARPHPTEIDTRLPGGA